MSLDIIRLTRQSSFFNSSVRAILLRRLAGDPIDFLDFLNISRSQLFSLIAMIQRQYIFYTHSLKSVRK